MRTFSIAISCFLGLVSFGYQINNPSPLKDSKELDTDSLVYLDCQICDTLIYERKRLYETYGMDSNYNNHINGIFGIISNPTFSWQMAHYFCEKAQKNVYGNQKDSVKKELRDNGLNWWDLETAQYYFSNRAKIFELKIPARTYQKLKIRPKIFRTESKQGWMEFMKNNKFAKTSTPPASLKLRDLNTLLNQMCSNIHGTWYELNLTTKFWVNQLLKIDIQTSKYELMGADRWSYYSEEENRYMGNYKNNIPIFDTVPKEQLYWRLNSIHPNYGFRGYFLHDIDTLLNLSLIMDSFNSHFCMYDILSFSNIQFDTLDPHKFKVDVMQSLYGESQDMLGADSIYLDYEKKMSYCKYQMTGYVN